MATLSRQIRESKRSKKIASFAVAAFCVLLITLFTFLNGQKFSTQTLLLSLDQEELHEGRNIGWYIDNDAATNAQAIREWRIQNYERACHPAEGANRSKQDEEMLQKDIHTMLQDLFQPSSGASATDFRSRITSCPLVFMDFGANVGDSLGKMISGGLEQPCLALHSNNTSTKRDLMLLRPRYEMSTGKMGLPKFYEPDASGRKSAYRLENKLIEFVNMFLREDLPPEEPVKIYTKTDFPDWKLKNPTLLRGPEDYCYFGVEGNPRFTKHLQQLERRVMSGHPRPLQNAHFFTESVITAKDGPTAIYLDNTNKEHNFWGSSILSSHTDVLSNQEQEGTPVSGITLTTLFRQTVKKQPGGQVLIKMDVEGAEWQVLNEAYDSGVLCEYSQAGVRIRALIEVHKEQQIGASPDMRRFYGSVIHNLKQCGVLLWLGTDAG